MQQVHHLDDIVVKCDKPNCFLNLCVHTLAAAQELENNHHCPYPGGSTNYSWEVTMTLVERMWEMADEVFREMNSDKMKNLTETDYYLKDTLRGKLVGYCEMIALFMSPHFASTKEVANEVVKRSTAEDGYETPGIGSRRFETPPNEPNKYAKATQSQKPPPPAIKNVAMREQVKPEFNLSETDVTSIRDMHTMMPAEHLASAFNVSVEVIRWVTSHDIEDSL